MILARAGQARNINVVMEHDNVYPERLRASVASQGGVEWIKSVAGNTSKNHEI